jgi:signal transduction histidine kinase
VRRLPAAPLVLGVVLGIALVVPIASFAAFTRATIESDISTRLQQDRLSSARLAALVVRQKIENDAADLSRFTTRPDLTEAIRTHDGPALEALLAGFSSPYQFKLLGIINAQGEVLAHVPTGLVDRSFALNIATQARAPSSQVDWVYLTPDLNAPSREGTAAVVVVRLDVAAEGLAVYGLLDTIHFASSLEPLALPTYRSILVLDEAGRVVASAASTATGPPQFSDFGEFPGRHRNTVAMPGLQQAVSAEPGTETVTLGNAERLATHAAVLPGHWVLYLLDDPALALAGERLLTEQVTVGAGVAAAVAAALAALLAMLIGRLRRQRAELTRLAISEERLRFARDLHDLLGRGLSLIAIKSELALRLVSGNAAAAKEIGDVERVAREALRDVREAVGGYREPRLATELDGARRALHAAGIECTIEQPGGDLPERIDALFAWSVREGVTNVIRHSGAARCAIRVSRGERDAQIEVTDDGLADPSGTPGYGLVGLRERAAARGGVAEAGAVAGGGFRLRIAVPLAAG